VVIVPRGRLLARGMGADCYDPSDDAIGYLYTASRGADMSDDYRGHRTPGWRQLLCAWFIVLTVAALFKISDFISANRTASFARATDLAQMAGEIEHWERGVPRQRTMTVQTPIRL
jgi:hypothetical protein